MLDLPDYEVVTASSGQEAIELARNRTFAVVLLDVQMPTMDGYETARHLRSLGGSAHPLPIVFVTAVEQPTDAAYIGGAVDFIQKPLNTTALRAKVAVFGDLYRAQREIEAEKEYATSALRLLVESALELSMVHTVSAVASAVVRHATNVVRADAAAIYILGDDGALALVAEEDGAPAHTLTKQTAPHLFARLRADDSVEYEQAIADSPIASARTQSAWAVPLVVEGVAMGVLVLASKVQQRLSPADRTLLDAVARQSAEALLRASRLERVERQQSRREFLVRASAALVSTLDYRATLPKVAALAIPMVADACSIVLRDPTELELTRIAAAHTDARAEKRALSLTQNAVARVIQSGKPELLGESTESAVVVPLRGRERVLGAASFVFVDSGRSYYADDVAFAEDLATRAAAAIENALALESSERAREAERRTRTHAEQANLAKDEFFALVSRELRTPLNAMLGWTVMLRAKKPEASIDAALAIIERNARRQAALVEDVLDFSRIVAGKITLRLAPTNLAEVVERAIESVTPAMSAKDLAIRTELDSSIELNADEGRLQQAIWNLLTNAIKFTPRGGATIVVRTSREGSRARISVADGGEGIDQAAIEFVFEPSRQADNSLTRRHGGLGLGLAIVRRIVEAHGGTAAATSAGAGLGAKITIDLPARVTAARPASDPARRPEQEPTTPIPQLSGVKVLVLDDEPDAVDLLSAMLGTFGASVATASSAREALDELPLVRPNVIVSDIGMPEMDGYTFIQRVRALPASSGRDTPAIALTAYTRNEDIGRARAAGYQLHLSKPVDVRALVEAIARLSQARTGP